MAREAEVHRRPIQTDLLLRTLIRENTVKALDGIDLDICKGEFLAIVGTSGSGKSTLLNMMGGLDVPTSGQVIVDGKELSTLNDEALTIFRRRKIGFIFQNYNLVPVLKILCCPWNWTVIRLTRSLWMK